MTNLYVIPHYDDELYCAGSIINDLINSKEVIIYVVCGNDKTREEKFKKIEEIFRGFVSSKPQDLKIIIEDLEPLFFKKCPSEYYTNIESTIEDIKIKYNIEKVYTAACDNHQDHCIINKIVRVAFRPDRYELINMLLEYNVPGSQSDFKGNFYKTINDYRFKTIVEMFKIYKDDLKGLNRFKEYEQLLVYNGSKLSVNRAELLNLVFSVN